MDTTSKVAPRAADDEVRGTFPNIAARDAAVAGLRAIGFAAADLTTDDKAASADAEAATHTDHRQARTLGTSLAASAGAIAAAGAVVASGGALLPVVGAAAAGAAVSGAVAGAAASAGGKAQSAPATTDGLIVAVRLADGARRDAAEIALRAAGAIRVERVQRRAA